MENHVAIGVEILGFAMVLYPKPIQLPLKLEIRPDTLDTLGWFFVVIGGLIYSDTLVDTWTIYSVLGVVALGAILSAKKRLP